MLNNKKVIVCDLDGTLAESKSTLSDAMSEVLAKILLKHYLVVVSGGSYKQFQKQFLSNFHAPTELLKNLFLFPTNGSTCYKYDQEKNDWQQVYSEPLTEEERGTIVRAFKEMMTESGLDFSESYGDIIEDRGGQVTFSGKGQNAPLEIKKVWDPDQTKRKNLVEILAKKIPQFEIRIGGATSIDVTRKGIDKAYAIEKIKEILHVTDQDIIYVGDALYKGGNDSAVKKTSVDFIQEDGPKEAIELLQQYT